MLILDAKYRFSPKAAIEILDSLHAYRDGLVDPDGREVVPFAVALTAAARRASRDYYTRRLFRRSGLGLILLEPQPPLAPAADLLSLEEVLDAYWSA